MSQSSPREMAREDDSRFELSRSTRLIAYACCITTAAAVLAAAILNVDPLLSANDRSRWSTVWSLVERGTYRIDEIDSLPAWNTIDKVRHEGHFYSSKPPLLATLVAGVSWSVKQATGWDLLRYTAPSVRLTLAIVNLIPLVLALIAVAAMAERYARTDLARLFVVFAASFATFVTTFAVTLNNHTAAAVSLIFALYASLRIVVDGERRPWLFAAAGFFAAFTCTNELPAALLGLALFGLLAWHDWRRTLFVFVPAALIPLSAYFVTNYLATGGWKPFYLYYGTDKYEYVHEGIPSYWMDPKGLDRATDTPLEYLFHCTLGHHGIFSLTPIWLLSATTWILLILGKLPADSERDRRLRIIHALGLGLTVAVLGFYLTRTANYNYGGNTSGLRWMFWLIPFWLLALVPALDRWGHSRAFRGLALALLAVSIFSATVPLKNPWKAPWLFTWMEQQGWIAYPPEEPPKFERPVWTWFPSLPDHEVFGSGAWAEFTAPALDGTQVRLRLEDSGIETVDGRERRTIVAIWQPGDANERRETFVIDVEQFRAGEPPSKFLVEPDANSSPAVRQHAETFLRGLPEPRPYREGVIRYLKTNVRTDAFRCQRAASRVLHTSSTNDTASWYRVDAWLSPDVPFGVVKVETTVSDAVTGAVLNHRVLTLDRVSTLRPDPHSR